MLFKFKKKLITVDAFTDQENIAKTPIAPSTKYVPDWFKSMKPTKAYAQNEMVVVSSTFKKCPGMIDNLKHSFTIPAWSDFIVKATDTGIVKQFPHSQFDYGAQYHNDPETSPIEAFAPKVHVKILSPWYLKSKSGVNFYQSQAFWSFNATNSTILIPPGVVNYKYQHSTHINMFITKNLQYDFERGDALMYLHPMSEDKVVIKTHVVDTEEYNKIKQSTFYPKFTNGYREMKK